MKEEKIIDSYKRYINGLEQKLEDYYRLDDSEDSFYKDDIEQLELSLVLLRKILNLIEKQQKENNYIHKDKIREKIKELEKEQEENRKNFSLGIELLSNNIIDKFSNKIMINFIIREYLKNILEESEIK